MGESIKVAYIVGGLPFGGVEVWLLDLVVAIQGDNRIIPTVINLSGTGELMDQYAARGVKVISIGNSKKAINTHRISTLFKLRAKLKSIDPDIIHTLHFSGDYFGRLASLGLGKPVFTHLRNTKTERKSFRRLANKALSYATSCYLSVSGQVAKTVARDHNIAERPSRVLYNATDSRKLDVPPFDLQKMYGLKGRTILGVGRFVEQKNFDKLIQAIALVREKQKDCSLLLLGDGSQMERLQKLVTQLKLDESIALPGYVKNEDIPRYLRAAYILAMPSDYEGLPITHVEALFCGLPAVISEHVPSKEIAANSSLICTTEVNDIANKLMDLLSDSTLHAKLSKAALLIAPEYSMGKYLEKLLALYSEFIDPPYKIPPRSQDKDLDTT